MGKKLLLDVDCGVDDAQAIMLAVAAPSVEILGITCVHGNTTVENVCKNVLRVLQACKKLGIPVFKGADKPILGLSIDAGHFHGQDGLGDAPDPNAPGLDLVQKEGAVSAMIRIVNENPGEDCPTRWGTKQKMVQRVLEQAPAIKRVFAADKSRRSLPNLTWQDVSVLEAVNAGLKPVADFTDILSAENYFSVSSLIPMLHHLRDTALKVNEEDADMTKMIKEEVLVQMDKKYDSDKTFRLMSTATLLDPRYKGDHFNPGQLGFIKTKLQVEMVELWSATRAAPPAVRLRVEEDEDDEAPQRPVKRTLGGL